jgi:multiple sugar transport system permease protein
MTMKTGRRHWSRDRREQAIVGYLFILPDVVGLLVFLVLPALMAFYVSMTDWQLLGPEEFVGFRNYAAIVGDKQFWASLGRGVRYTIGYVPVVYTLALGMALLLTRRSPATGFFRTIYFMPVAMSLVIAGVVWRFILDPGVGLVNQILRTAGLPTSRWMGSVDTAMYSVIIPAVWKSAGYFMVILLAGIQDIPRAYLESAAIDGANGWEVLRHIIMPLLKPTSFFALVILTLGALQAFDQIWVMTRGGPAYATYTSVMYIYEEAFRYWRFGYSTAMSVVLFGLVLALTLIQQRFFRAADVG